MAAKKDQAQRVGKIMALLEKTYPDADCTLNFDSPLELLIATILAAQCTDERVNQVTQTLFKKYRAARDYANAKLEVLQNDIKTTGFFRQKAKSVKAVCKTLVEKYDGNVPADMESLTALAGVGRKTGNVVLGNAFGIPGIIVDTHVRRLSGRLGLSRQKDPDKIEMDLMKIVPREKWTQWSHLLVAHGRAVCTAKKPDCDACAIKRLCPCAFKV